MNPKLSISLLGIFLALLGCEKSLTKNQNSANNWLITGRMAEADFALGEIVALALNGTRHHAEITAHESFRLNLPGNNTYALYFLPLPNTKTSTKPGASALLTFEESEEVGMRDTLRLPKATNNANLDLGAISIKGDFAYASNNPSLKLDFDNDGINDFQDRDDQNDGLPDTQQNSEIEQISICHNSQMLKLSLTTLLTHIDHGDHIGPCDSKKSVSKKNPKKQRPS